VGFCPFRGPDASLTLVASYHMPSVRPHSRGVSLFIVRGLVMSAAHLPVESAHNHGKH